MTVSVLIPFGGMCTFRRDALAWVRRWWAHALPEAEVLVGDDPTTGEGWCKSAALNALASRATGDIFVLADADCFMPIETLRSGLSAANKTRRVVYPWDAFYRLTKQASALILSRPPGTVTLGDSVDVEMLQGPNPGGLLIVPRDTYFTAGGHDERFRGWGAEDSAFYTATEALTGKPVQGSGPLWHLWHPNLQQIGNPHYTDNCRLYEGYAAAQNDPEKMRALVGGKRKVDTWARCRQYIDHLVPIWKAIPSEHRGEFFVSSAMEDYLRSQDIEPVTTDDLPPEVLLCGDRPIMVAGFEDARFCKTTTRPLVVVEHGNGQTLTGCDHSAYASGKDRGYYDVFIVPGPNAAEAARISQPDTRTVQVGCPKLDEYHAVVPKPVGERPVVAFGWHWDSPILPETRTAWPHYAQAIADLAADPDRPYDVIGHSHPMSWDEMEPIYERLGIPTIKNFEDVLRTADLYVADCTSTLYEFASTGRPVLCLNAPWYRRNVHHGLRFWDAIPGLQCDDPDQLRSFIQMALEDPPKAREMRSRGVSRAYLATDGQAAERAADAVVEARKIDNRPSAADIKRLEDLGVFVPSTWSAQQVQQILSDILGSSPAPYIPRKPSAGRYRRGPSPRG